MLCILGTSAVLVGLGGMALCEPSDSGLLTLTDLEQTEEALMSCAEVPPVGSAPLWCGDEDSPRCTPATPVESPETPSAGQPAFAQPDALADGSCAHLALADRWPAPAPDRGPLPTEQRRLERPPRRV